MAATAVWPPTLPYGVLLRSMDLTPESRKLRSQMTGVAKQRTSTTAEVEQVQVELHMTREQYLEVFRPFFHTTLGGGVMPFRWLHPTSGYPIDARFVGEYAMRQRSPRVIDTRDKITVRYTLEVFPGTEDDGTEPPPAPPDYLGELLLHPFVITGESGLPEWPELGHSFVGPIEGASYMAGAPGGAGPGIPTEPDDPPAEFSWEALGVFVIPVVEGDPDPGVVWAGETQISVIGVVNPPGGEPGIGGDLGGGMNGGVPGSDWGLAFGGN